MFWDTLCRCEWERENAASKRKVRRKEEERMWCDDLKSLVSGEKENMKIAIQYIAGMNYSEGIR